MRTSSFRDRRPFGARRLARLAWLACTLAWLGGCAARDSGLEGAAAIDEPSGTVEERLFPVDLVMAHQAAIGLDEAQTSAIRGELQAAQRDLVEAEWALGRDREALSGVLAGQRVDEAAAMEAAERVIEREGAIKRVHLRMLVRIKNHLTAEQQRALEARRR